MNRIGSYLQISMKLEVVNLSFAPFFPLTFRVIEPLGKCEASNQQIDLLFKASKNYFVGECITQKVCFQK